LTEASLQTDFIPLLREATTAEKLDRLEHEPEQDYRSIAGYLKPGELEADESDGDSVFEDETGGESAHERLLRRNTEFDRKLKETPSDSQVWLDFVAFQDELGAGRNASRAEKRGSEEVKLSILERALRVEELEGDERLLLTYLACVTELWESSKVLDTWRQVLENHPGQTGLWTAYVSFRQTDGTTFTVNKMIEVFEECLDVLRSKADSQPSGSSGAHRCRREQPWVPSS
jgi:hypothetical protein